MKFEIKKITQQDRAEFLQMSQAFYASEAVLHAIPLEYHQRAFDELMRSAVYLDGYLLQTDAKTVGYALLNKSYSREVGGVVVWVEELYIQPEYRSSGFGSAFFRWLEEHIPAARYRLEVEPENKKAIALYQRMGYTRLPYEQMIKDT